jgi:hypothetical protein
MLPSNFMKKGHLPEYATCQVKSYIAENRRLINISCTRGQEARGAKLQECAGKLMKTRIEKMSVWAYAGKVNINKPLIIAGPATYRKISWLAKPAGSNCNSWNRLSCVEFAEATHPIGVSTFEEKQGDGRDVVPVSEPNARESIVDARRPPRLRGGLQTRPNDLHETIDGLKA